MRCGCWVERELQRLREQHLLPPWVTASRTRDLHPSLSSDNGQNQRLVFNCACLDGTNIKRGNKIIPIMFGLVVTI